MIAGLLVVGIVIFCFGGGLYLGNKIAESFYKGGSRAARIVIATAIGTSAAVGGGIVGDNLVSERNSDVVEDTAIVEPASSASHNYHKLLTPADIDYDGEVYRNVWQSLDDRYSCNFTASGNKTLAAFEIYRLESPATAESWFSSLRANNEESQTVEPVTNLGDQAFTVSYRHKHEIYVLSNKHVFEVHVLSDHIEFARGLSWCRRYAETVLSRLKQ
jgi:hypothetical protein